MAVIDTFPCDPFIARKVLAPKVIVSIKPKDKLPPVQIPITTRAHLTPKERYLIEWLASEEGKASLSIMPSKAGILAMVRLSAKKLIKVDIEFTDYGRHIFEEMTRKEELSADRTARKIQIKRHEMRGRYKVRTP